jgi:hypothetical protein
MTLGLDSLGKVEAIFALEERFGISIPFNANEPDQPDFGFASVPEIVEGVARLMAAARMRRVVVTGMGTVNALAHDVPGFQAALRAGRSGIGPLGFRDADRLAIRIGAEVREWEPLAHLPAARLPLYDRVTQYALVAGAEAMAMAGLPAGLGAARGCHPGHGGGGDFDLGGQLSRGLCRGEEPGVAADGAAIDAQCGRLASVDHLGADGAGIFGVFGLCQRQSRDGAGVAADPGRGCGCDAGGGRGGDAVLWRRQGLGGVARAGPGCVPPVLAWS